MVTLIATLGGGSREAGNPSSAEWPVAAGDVR